MPNGPTVVTDAGLIREARKHVRKAARAAHMAYSLLRHVDLNDLRDDAHTLYVHAEDLSAQLRTTR